MQPIILKQKYEYVIYHYSHLFIGISILLALVPFVFIIVRSIIQPGLHYCGMDYNDCASINLEVGIPDIGIVIFGKSIHFVQYVKN